jgi:hypothetical protein
MRTYDWMVEGLLRKSPNGAPVSIRLFGDLDSPKQEMGKIIQALTQRIEKEFQEMPYLECISITICPKEDDGKAVAS